MPLLVCVLVREANPQLSVAVGSTQLAIPMQLNPSSSTIISCGILVMTGATLSSRVIFCIQELWNLFAGFVANQVLCIDIAPLHEPEVITSLKVIYGVPLQNGPVINEEANPVTNGPGIFPSIGQEVYGAGQVITGDVSQTLHDTVTVKDACTVLPQLSLSLIHI